MPDLTKVTVDERDMTKITVDEPDMTQVTDALPRPPDLLPRWFHSFAVPH